MAKSSSSSAFTGGKLSLKGDKKKAKKRSKKSKHLLEDTEQSDMAAKTSAALSQQTDYLDNTIGDDRNRDKNEHRDSSDDDDLTAAEKRSRKFKRKRERKEMGQVVSMSHRERVEQFNEKLGQLTELNDIPRVSAAGNG